MNRLARLFASLLLIAISAAVSAQTNTTAADTNAPGVTTGQRIGNIVKAAVTTAFPAVSTVLDAILSKTKNGDSNKVSTSDLKSAATSSAVKTDVSAKAQSGAAQAIAPIGLIAGELQTVNSFLAPTVLANDNVLLMDAGLAASSPNWDEIQIDWKVAKAQLDKISKVQDSDLNKVQDAFIRIKLQSIRDTNGDLVIRIDAALSNKDKNVPKTRALLQQLRQILDGMTSVAGYELANFQSDFTSLSAWAKGAGGQTKQSDSLETYTKALGSSPSKTQP
jgi:hypothetical protein